MSIPSLLPIPTFKLLLSCNTLCLFEVFSLQINSLAATVYLVIDHIVKKLILVHILPLHTILVIILADFNTHVGNLSNIHPLCFSPSILKTTTSIPKTLFLNFCLWYHAPGLSLPRTCHLLIMTVIIPCLIVPSCAFNMPAQVPQ